MTSKSSVVPSVEVSQRVNHHQHRRTRTGCERCRAQHRKCDEGRPRCKRCTNADSVCKYATHLSFKLKNSFTLPEGIGLRPDGPSGPLTYNSIEFRFEGSPGRTRSKNHPASPTTEIAELERRPTHETRRSPSLILAQSPPTIDNCLLSAAEIELLKFYANSVSPWLDVYDQRQTFRHRVTRLAMSTPPLLEGILQLSALCANRPIESVARRGAGVSHFHYMISPPDEQSPLAALEAIGCFVLARALLFVDTVPGTWEPSFHGSGAISYFRKFRFSDAAERDAWFALLTLILRLEIAYCLMYCRAPVFMPELIQHILNELASYATSVERSQQVLYCCLRCLKLLVDAMNFAFGATEYGGDTSTSRSAPPDIARLSQWEGLMEQLGSWYNDRPQELTPLLETDGAQGTLPTLVYSNGSGVAANALSHTAILLLLSSKPQPSSDLEAQMNMDMEGTRSTLMWHARRICGIAVNSEPERMGCWDPTLIAAFGLAARHITEPSERREIATCLARVQATGWCIDSLVKSLHKEWGIND